MSWQRKLPNLRRLNKLKQMSKEEVLQPLIVEMPETAIANRYFVVVEFGTDVIVEMFKTKKEAHLFASAIAETLEII